jgi:UDP-N-acetylglucosamine--N-acetylmuramyl-(pentapeptide) pyrophosphoryl-undecaprenol N-acetylglucosamine transferase
VPYPHSIDDHQTFNAHAVDAAGGGWLIPDEAFSSSVLADRFNSLFTLPKSLANAAAASRAAGLPDAAVRLANLVIELLNSNGDQPSRREAA